MRRNETVFSGQHRRVQQEDLRASLAHLDSLTASGRRVSLVKIQQRCNKPNKQHSGQDTSPAATITTTRSD